MDPRDEEPTTTPAPRPRKKKKVRPRRDPAEAAAAITEGISEESAADAGLATVPHGDVTAAARWPLLVAAAGATLALGLVGTGPSDLGMWLALASGIGLVASIHRLGRLGPS